jgi:magnesium transporter
MLEIFYLDKTIKKADVKQLPKLKSRQLWIDCTDITKEEAETLQKTFDLHPLTAEDLFNSGVRIKVEEFPDYLFCVFYAIQKAKQTELSEFDLVLGKDFLITNHKKLLESTTALKQDNKRLQRNLEKGLSFLFHRLIDIEVDAYFPIVEQIEDQIELLEDRALKKAVPKVLSEVLAMKRLVVRVKRYALQQREKLGFLAKNEYAHVPKKAIPYFRDVYDHAIRVSDQLDGQREAIGNAFDVYMSSLSNSMNEVMKVLSIIATIALPLTVISGIYGTNFTVLPGSTFALGFWTMILAMVLLAAVMIWYFRRKRWF